MAPVARALRGVRLRPRRGSGARDLSRAGARPRLLLVARGRYGLPLDEPLQRKFDALSAEFELRVLAGATEDSADERDERFHLAPPIRPRRLDGLAFYAALPARVARELRDFRPDAVLVQGTHETAAVLLGRRLARADATVILDLHGDWRQATRMYGSPVRRLLDPAGDLLSEIAVRKADAIRTISGFTTGLVREVGRRPTAVFPAYVDAALLLDRRPEPLPERPQALFVGVLERSKNVDGLVEAWRRAAPRLPEAVSLRIVGRGRLASVVEELVDELPGRVFWTPELDPAGVSHALDAATVLLLPSRTEGLPRIVIEAFARGRGVIGARAGGIPDLVEDEENGLLVHPDDREALAGALIRVLSDVQLAERLGRRSREVADRWISTPVEYAARVRALVARAAARRGLD